MMMATNQIDNFEKFINKDTKNNLSSIYFYFNFIYKNL